jgi:hypothetical protein
MRGLDPRIHRKKSFCDGLPGHRRAEATPFFERLSPAMTIQNKSPGAMLRGFFIFSRAQVRVRIRIMKLS